MSGSVVDFFRYGGASRAVALMTACAPVDMPGGLVRIGGPGDGGYLVPRDTQGIKAVFSPGVDQAAGFERDFADRGVPCLMADKSVDGPPFAHPNFHFLKKHLGAVTGSDTITLAEWVQMADVPDGDLLLQMDIEGAEYDVIPACPRALLGRFRVIVIELHRLGRLVRPIVHRRVSATLKKLLEQHVVVHLHANNAAAPKRWCGLQVHPVVEFTFVRRDCVGRSERVRSLPHPLDAPNVPGRPEWPLDPAWLGLRT